MSIEKFVEQFDESFNTNIASEMKNRKFPMLEYVFNELADEIYSLNSESRKNSKEKIKIYDELEETLTDKQRDLINKYFDADGEFLDITERQIFVFGYLLCFEEMREMGQLK